MKILIFTVLFSQLNIIVFSQKHVELLKSQIPSRFETSERLRYFELFECDSVVGGFCSSKDFDHITDKNKLSDKKGIGLKYLGDEALSDSIFYKGLFFVGLMKVVDDSGIKKIIDFNDGPLNRVEYEYDSTGTLVVETHYWNGEQYIWRWWENGKVQCQSVSPLKNGTFESFCFDSDRLFTWYSIVVRNDTSFLNKKYTYSNVNIETFKISYQDQGCKEILEVNYYPGFVISRSEYITDCIFETNSFEVNYYLTRKIQSSGRYVYSSMNIQHEKTKRIKIGEWKYYDLNNIVNKIVIYDENGIEIECKGECN